jgi:hypothetical protein
METKVVVTLDINYNKEISSLTRPYLELYANKIGADLKIISERKFLDSPINIEKFQLYEISKNYDWTIFVDADALVHPNCPDLTEIYPKDTVIFNGMDYYGFRYKHNNYTRRDGRNIGACTWLCAFSDWTRDLWHPYKNPLQYVDQINIMDAEVNFGYEPRHVLDDYLVSLNIAKYGLKHKTINYDILPEYNETKYSYFVNHEFCISEESKLIQIKKWIKQFNTSVKREFAHFQDCVIDMKEVNDLLDKFSLNTVNVELK